MGLDARFIVTSDLESLFRDKTTGLPLAGGIVTFYSDINRAIKKPVYQLTGSPPNYSYAPLPNPCFLSTKGTFQDADGNNIVAYYYPYEGDPDDFTGTIELYYIVVENSGGVEQFTREAWPNFTAADTSADNAFENYIPNGQFLIHNDQPITEVVGSNDVTYIAQGGWAVKVTTGSTTVIETDDKFNRITTAVAGIDDYPRYSFNFNCSTAGNAVVKDLAIDFPDVFKFSAGTTQGEQDYTLLFAGQSGDGASYTFDVRLIYNYGSDSVSPEEDVSIGSITINPGYGYHTLSISGFPEPTGTLGTLNDDYVSITLRGPNSTWDVDVTDFTLVQGNVSIPFFPTQTNANMQALSVAGWKATPPKPDGYDLYLPMVMTPRGMTFDHSSIGSVTGKFQLTATADQNELLMDGSTYVYSDYNAITGIPYARLGDYLIANSPAVTIGTSTIPAQTIPMFGTGANFVTVLKNTDPTKFDLSMNTSSGSNAVNDQTSGFTHTSADPLYVFTVGSVPSASTYFSFTPNTGGALVYNVWFSVDGAGTAPATPTGANIEVALVTGDTVATTITKIVTAVNQYQFMVLDARGYFWRGLDQGTSVDPNSATRTVNGIKDNASLFTGAHLGSHELDAYKSHTHPPLTGNSFITNGSTTVGGSGTSWTGDATTGASGGAETRPVNLAIQWFIKY